MLGQAVDSTQAGYLQPTTENLDGVSWEDFLHDTIAGCTALDPTMVRPRWQPQPPTTPDLSTDWCAFGIMNVEADYEPWRDHYWAPDPGSDLMQRMEKQTILCSFYGPNAMENAGILRDGIYVDQNRALFRANAVGLIEMGPITRTADLYRQQFRERADINLIIRREVRRIYQVRSLLRAISDMAANNFASTTVITRTIDTAGLGGIPPIPQILTMWDFGADFGYTVWDNGVTDWR